MPLNIIRIFFYRVVLGYNIDFHSKVGFLSVIVCNKVNLCRCRIGMLNYISCVELTMKEGAWINNFNKVLLLNKLYLDKGAGIKNKNAVTGLYEESFETRDNCNLILGESSLITNQHGVDCTSEVIIGSNVVVAGSATQIWTHGFDHKRNMILKPLTIGDNVYVGSRSLLLGGVICNDVVIGAGTTVSKTITKPGLYVSNKLEYKNIYEFN